MTLAELLALIANLASLSIDDLAELEANLEAAAEERADATSQEALDELVQIRDAVRAVRTEGAARAEETAAREAAAAEALAEIRGQGPEDDDADEDADASEGDADEDDGTQDVVSEAEAVVADAPETVAASGADATPAPRAPRIGGVNARRPRTTQPRTQTQTEVPFHQLGLVASANVPGFTAGESIQDAEKLATLFYEAVKATQGYKHGPRVQMKLVRAGSERPEDLGWSQDRILDRDLRGNMRKITAATSPQSVRAAGGICAPAPVQYNLPILAGSDARPVRDDMLVRFAADRGGVVTLPPPVLTDLDDAITVWTAENDENPSSPTEKNCLTVTCPTEDEELVDAIVMCLQFGNFRARYFAEQIEAWMRLAAVNHARQAEILSLQKIGSGSTQVSHGQGLGTIPDVLATLDLATAGMASRHRDVPSFRWGAPAWLRNQMRADEARRMPGGGTTDERYALAEAKIDSWFSARGINPTWFLDGESGQIFGAQGDGPLVGWPSTVVTYLYPEGSWLFLDGGTLDLGIVRDSTLNSTNEVQWFSESFEATHFHGVESQRLTIDTCPDGSVSGTVDFDPCSTGS